MTQNKNRTEQNRVSHTWMSYNREREIQCCKSTESYSLSISDRTFKNTHTHTQTQHQDPEKERKKKWLLWNDIYALPCFPLNLGNATVTMDAAGEPHSSSKHRVEGSQEDPNRTGSGHTSTARYKLMSPAKLPISRSPCITIPPGLSPTSFLESPVLLSNMKVSLHFASSSSSALAPIEVFSLGKSKKLCTMRQNFQLGFVFYNKKIE